MSEIFRVADRVSSEVLDSEVMILDLSNGNYYNLSGSGAMIWKSLEAGACFEEILRTVLAQVDGDRDEIADVLSGLLVQLESENLIQRHAAPEAAPAREVAVAPGRVPFQQPLFHKFTDLQDLLLVDPIHDVDMAGWPRAKN